tara:strand:- start:950 stop:2035 length:1086 start_codon:yes stop_codon:yes gene_type:complete
MKIDFIAGARPNFIKIASIIHAVDTLNLKEIKYRLVHTGQHYDKNMSGNFFDQLNIPNPDINLEVKSGSQSEQTGKIMIRYESLLKNNPTDFCLVVGDVNSTMACSIVAKKMNTKVIHIEAGIRSWDMTMPEEINRIVTDSITDYFFTTSVLASQNLTNCGVPKHKIFFVGNTMIDTLMRFKKDFLKPSIWDKIKLKKKSYIILTLHRPHNVDFKEQLHSIIKEILYSAKNIPVIFPVHPRTAKQLNTIHFDNPNLHLISPLSYLEFNYLVERSMAVITDSGGISEETTVMNVPCMTLRNNTERPETVKYGTNEIIGASTKLIKPMLEKLILGNWKSGQAPALWDGKSGDRIIQTIINLKK